MDNTQVNNGSGDVIRDIDRGTAKTQVVVLDAGGQSAESLVSPTNPLPVGPSAVQSFAGGIPVDDANLNAAQTQDQPLFTALVGDPNGDFAGVNLLEQVMDDGSGLALNVTVKNFAELKRDANGALILSDCQAVNINLGTNQATIIDVSGYQSIHMTSPSIGGLTSSTISFSNDGVIFSPALGALVTNSASPPVANIMAGQNVVFPVLGKYLRIATTFNPGSLVLYLRNVPAPNPAVVMPQNIAQIGGAVPSSISAGTGFVVAGFTSPGSQFANSPVGVGGTDSGTVGVTPLGSSTKGAPAVRTLLTDNTGRLRLAQETPVQSLQNAPALNVQDSSQFEGQSLSELLAMMLLELRITNELQAGLPARLYAMLQSLQLAPNSQNQFAGLASTDEPAAFRLDPSLFN